MTQDSKTREGGEKMALPEYVNITGLLPKMIQTLGCEFSCGTFVLTKEEGNHYLLVVDNANAQHVLEFGNTRRVVKKDNRIVTTHDATDEIHA
mmetsp:Transcript_14713/g.34030  ORF Transcript_14713/g.34030 Transcript_14713/m.34030 type:complete len:93 (-) Transcript_14713:644-922(-)